MTTLNDQLFTVRVAVPPPGKGRWKVVVRAASQAAAAERIAERGHRVLSVEAGCEKPSQSQGITRSIPECVACGYSIKELPPEETFEVTCPECGTINLGIELPTFDSPISMTSSMRRVRWFTYGFIAILALGVVLLVISRF